MRAPGLPAALVAALLLAVAPATSLAAGADTVTVRERQVDANPGETNPCTGATGTIVDVEQDVFHITALPDGAYHLTGHSAVHVSFVPDNPGEVAYEGHETFAVAESSTSRTFVTTTTNDVHVRGTDGTFVTLREVAHLTVSPTGITASFDRPTFLCS